MNSRPRERIQKIAACAFDLGFHLGDVVQKADGFRLRDGVNVAARLKAARSAGGIVASNPFGLPSATKVAACSRTSGSLAQNIASPSRATLVRAHRALTALGITTPAMALAAPGKRPCRCWRRSPRLRSRSSVPGLDKFACVIQ